MPRGNEVPRVFNQAAEIARSRVASHYYRDCGPVVAEYAHVGIRLRVMMDGGQKGGEFECDNLSTPGKRERLEDSEACVVEYQVDDEFVATLAREPLPAASA